MFTTISEKKVEIIFASASPSGHGHYKIVVEMAMDRSINHFTAKTNNMPGLDAALDLEHQQKKYFALYELIEQQIEKEIREWILSL